MKHILKLAVLAAAVTVAQPALAGKVSVCHKGTDNISISSSALSAHLRHGDAEGYCPVVTPEPEPIRVAVMRCDAIDGDVLVISASGSQDDLVVPVPLPALPGDNCATAVATLLNLGWELEFVTSGSSVTLAEGESGFVTEYTFVSDPSDSDDDSDDEDDD